MKSQKFLLIVQKEKKVSEKQFPQKVALDSQKAVLTAVTKKFGKKSEYYH